MTETSSYLPPHLSDVFWALGALGLVVLLIYLAIGLGVSAWLDARRPWITSRERRRVMKDAYYVSSLLASAVVMSMLWLAVAH